MPLACISSFAGAFAAPLCYPFPSSRHAPGSIQLVLDGSPSPNTSSDPNVRRSTHSAANVITVHQC
ncbi:hypothetical protein K488DRAFT_92920 [Vararia minispora EC-137]|uniref:Uncharacterized protein n=1 Tax=Vararia minispora EC-137 TaxID=1314806 RepID=A0ACB8Q3B1_9AGAM|nr:hypothetical protein K488DRAFT_92920 [Vararia minispora EC-137]